MADIKGKI